MNLLLKAELINLDPMMNSEIIIKSYISYYLQTSEELQLFYKYLNEKYMKHFDLKYTNGSVDSDLENEIKTSLENIYRLESLFPYKKGDSLGYISMPFLIGENNFTTNRTSFSNCVEGAIYHICNCLLWDPKSKEYIKVELLNKKSESKISGIFNNKIKGMPDMNELKKWHKIVENSNNNEAIPDEATAIACSP